MEIVCIGCGSFVAASDQAEPGEKLTVRCPECGAEISYRIGNPAATARIAPASGPPGSPAGPGALGPAAEQDESSPSPSGYSTLFHPGTIGEDEPSPDAPAPASPAGGDDAAETVLLGPGEPSSPPSPPRQGGFFLVIGAEAGRERLPLCAARTVFGRRAADVDLGDPAVSDRHFQVEIAGREFYLRDLASRNGTFLNGRRIRYAELLPGDEVLAGSTYLVFRTRQDGFERERASDREGSPS